MLRPLLAIIGIAAAGALLSIPPNGQGWGWTHWDMTDAQVAAQSGGKVGRARRGPPRHLEFEPLLHAEADIEQDGFRLRASFAFTSDDRRLKFVSLGPPDYAQCWRLRRHMVDKLGTPYEAYVERGPLGGGRTYRWANDGRGNHLTYTEFMPRSDRPGLCRLIYAPAPVARTRTRRPL